MNLESFRGFLARSCMGAWGAGVFENDAALDWVQKWLAEPDSHLIVQTLQHAIQAEYLDADAAAEGLAAVSVLAAAQARHLPGTPPELIQATADHPIEVNPEMLELGQNAVQRIALKSELKELWTESDREAEWKEVVNGILAALEDGPVAN